MRHRQEHPEHLLGPVGDGWVVVRMDENRPSAPTLVEVDVILSAASAPTGLVGADVVEVLGDSHAVPTHFSGRLGSKDPSSSIDHKLSRTTVYDVTTGIPPNSRCEIERESGELVAI
jgi:hypothetical protein